MGSSSPLSTGLEFGKNGADATSIQTRQSWCYLGLRNSRIWGALCIQSCVCCWSQLVGVICSVLTLVMGNVTVACDDNVDLWFGGGEPKLRGFSLLEWLVRPVCVFVCSVW